MSYADSGCQHVTCCRAVFRLVTDARKELQSTPESCLFLFVRGLLMLIDG